MSNFAALLANDEWIDMADNLLLASVHSKFSQNEM